MRKVRYAIIAILVSLLVRVAFAEQDMQRVDYLSDSIAEKEGKYIRLLGGSQWVLSSSTLALVTDDIIIVLKTYGSEKSGVAYVDGDELTAKHIGGQIFSQTGYLTTVIESLGDGAVLKMADASLVSVPMYDQYHSRYWLAPYKALISSSKTHLWNLKKGKRISINAR